MLIQTKRYKPLTEESTDKERQLSSLFSIISNNILVATEVLSTDRKIKTVQELELLSRKAKQLAKELMSKSSSSKLSHEDLSKRISFLKHRMLDLVVNLTEELSKLDSSKSTNKKAIEDIVLARRLLRESQRGLITIQD
ncbi:MAG: hypothetical protein HYY52_02415 [Candidatus Melainabacteria bacterium]|nr:hypothetical protein [Candidatus Melainabacteria bacterium]